jgi:hypothetical protein
MSFSERREGSDRRGRDDRRHAVVGQDLYERLKEKRIEIERDRREGPRRRQADRRTTKDPRTTTSNPDDEAQRGAEHAGEDAG